VSGVFLLRELGEARVHHRHRLSHVFRFTLLIGGFFWVLWAVVVGGDGGRTPPVFVKADDGSCCLVFLVID